MKYLYIVLIVLITFTSFSQNTEYKKVTTGYKVKGTYKSYIYSSPNKQSNTKKSINRFSPTVIEESKRWLVVKYHLDETTLAYGYVKREETFIEQYYMGDNNMLNISPLSWERNNKQFVITIRNYKTAEIKDSLTITNTHHGERFLELPYSSGLKNVKKMIRFQTYRESCPGLTQNEFIIVSNDNKIKHLITDISTGEIGWESETTYLPVQFGNGTIKLLYFDYEGKIINYKTGELTELKDSKSYKIPLNELIIKQIEIGDPVIKNDDYVTDENDDYIIESSSKTDVYRWDGKQLNQIK